MENYLERTLNRKIRVSKLTEGKLPIMFYGLYDIYEVSSGEFRWLMVRPKKKINLRDLRNHFGRISSITGVECGFWFDSVSNYIKDTLVEERIPFIITGRQTFLPFAGLAVDTNRNRRILPVHEISFLTQKVLLSAIYDQWDNMNVTETAKAMGVSKTSITRVMDELEYLNLTVLNSNGKSRRISVGKDIRNIWEEVKPILRNPVIKEFELKKDISYNYVSGITALSQYSLLNDNNYPTYGVTKYEIGKLNLTDKLSVSGEKICCKVQELGYMINYREKNQMDPLSIVLSLDDVELSDERISIAVDEMLEEYVW